MTVLKGQNQLHQLLAQFALPRKGDNHATPASYGNAATAKNLNKELPILYHDEQILRLSTTCLKQGSLEDGCVLPA